MSQEVIINVGVSGAGKSTWSTEYIKKHPNYVRINRDDIRKMLRGNLDGYYKLRNLNSLESAINKIEEATFAELMSRGHSVIIDNTNLKPSYIKRWTDLLDQNNRPAHIIPASLRFKLFPEADADTLKKRVNVRDAPLGWDKLDYIDKQVASLQGIIKYVQEKYPNQIIGE